MIITTVYHRKKNPSKNPIDKTRSIKLRIPLNYFYALWSWHQCKISFNSESEKNQHKFQPLLLVRRHSEFSLLYLILF